MKRILISVLMLTTVGGMIAGCGEAQQTTLKEKGEIQQIAPTEQKNKVDKGVDIKTISKIPVDWEKTQEKITLKYVTASRINYGLDSFTITVDEEKNELEIEVKEKESKMMKYEEPTNDEKEEALNDSISRIYDCLEYKNGEIEKYESALVELKETEIKGQLKAVYTSLGDLPKVYNIIFNLYNYKGELIYERTLNL